MSRVTAPVSKLARALRSLPAGVMTPRSSTTIFDSSAHNAGASLMPKYAELLHNSRSHEHSDSPRGLTTTHRPTPQPSLVNRPRPLMQTFHNSASPTVHTSAHIDAAVLPSTAFLSADFSSSDHGPRVPLLPDNYGAAHGPFVADPSTPSGVTIVAANPENVLPGPPNAAVEGINLDSIELKFIYDEPAAPREEHARAGMIRDIWSGLVGSVLGGTAKKTAV